MAPKILVTPLSAWKLCVRDKFLVAGPCSVESESQVLQTAVQLARHDVTLLRGGIWKSRTRPGLFEGVGSIGLAWLKNAGRATGLPVATEVTRAAQVDLCLSAGVDVLWIGARTTTNPIAVQEIANALRGIDIPVMIKNPMNPDLELWMGAIERIKQAGITRIMAVHRGFSSYRGNPYRNQPIWRIPVELRRRMPELPLICDPSHICGNRKYIGIVAQQAMDFLFDGLMVEVHCAPRAALSDAQQQLTPAQYGRLIVWLRHLFSNPAAQLPARIEILRREIDTIDDELIELLARRISIVREIGHWKRRHTISIFQPERWASILLDRAESSVRKGLSESFARDLFERIHEESLTIQANIPPKRSD